MSSSKNLDYKKTSFLSKANSTFIEEMYIKFIKNDPTLPESWKNYFNDLNEDIKSVAKEIEGPTWNPKKIKIDIKRNESENLENVENLDSNSNNLDREKTNSIKAIALIRAYRIRGHLIANLDPLGLMKREYLHELHPADHGFKKEDYDKKIYLDSYLDLGRASINEILSML